MDADSRVFYFKTIQHRIIELLLHSDPYRYATLCGELDGVANKIGDDLLVARLGRQSRRLAGQSASHVQQQLLLLYLRLE